MASLPVLQERTDQMSEPAQRPAFRVQFLPVPQPGDGTLRRGECTGFNDRVLVLWAALGGARVGKLGPGQLWVGLRWANRGLGSCHLVLARTSHLDSGDGLELAAVLSLLARKPGTWQVAAHTEQKVAGFSLAS